MIQFILKYWIEFLFSSLIAGFIYVFKQYIGLKNGMISLLKSEIVRIYEVYTKSGYCPSYMKENINDMYINYKRLGGNGMVTAMVNELFGLPCEPKMEGDE